MTQDKAKKEVRQYLDDEHWTVIEIQHCLYSKTANVHVVLQRTDRNAKARQITTLRLEIAKLQRQADELENELSAAPNGNH